MKLSKYVLDAIAAISVSGSRHNHQATRDLREASEATENAVDAHVLKLVGGILSMSYSVKHQEFAPLAILEGKRTFAMEDIQPEDVETIEALSTTVDNYWVQARLSHVAWILTNKHRYGQLAVTGYLQWFEKTFNPEHWTDCAHAIQCALHISLLLGKKTASYRNTREVINAKIELLDGADSLFLSISLLKLVIKDATQKELESYLPIVSKLASKNICMTNDNSTLADETFYVQELILKRLKRQSDIDAATTAYAIYYEDYANRLDRSGDYYRAVIMLKKACILCGNIDREKLLVLRSKLEELQKKALNQMQSIPYTINTESTYKQLDQLFDGLSIEEGIVQIGRLAKIYKVEEVKQQVIKWKQDSVVSAMYGSSMINEKGQTVQELPPLSEGDIRENSDILFKHMVRQVSKQRGIAESIALEYAFHLLKQIGDFKEDKLDFLVQGNPIVPENRQEIVREGLYLGLTGKVYTAMHILLPQTEHIFRNLVKICGDTVTYLKDDGTESYKPLSALFGSEKLRECYSEDIIFTFRSIMDEPIGANLRNLNAHGLLEPSVGNSMSAVCFLCLLIKLLIMYSQETKPILKKLSERE